ncbi:serine hydrolase domain-containing protein [Pyxidicoccus xibeiensis]|uniref:serine hydrolase domain-containing protein n=1 Tax=Pyxidicoccus xibeiensis TaxID=2906759 RepID=UPI0020A7F0BD|nr:serine hydrolase domain-containing protein [Pyxidicoccus xibeiensis]MCP3143562.1 beta-lactamase family protein [Pyxidicoccus xibeiensis]
MSTGGLSRARLVRMHDVMARHVERGEVPGLVMLVGRRGEAHVDVIGEKAFGGEPMRRDTLFRITSMTKPITAVATMILVEECRLWLDAPVERWLPELADRRVLKRIDGSLEDTVPAQRPITVRDLLTFRLGFGAVMAPPDRYPIQRAVRELQLSLGPPKPASPHSPDEWLRRFATLPLMYQPGERWLYNTGSHLLGVLIERVSGQPLETFLRERIFEPLGMKDTGFSVPPEKQERLATCYADGGESGALVISDGVGDSQWSQPPAFPDGAAGLVSTVDDYLAFGQMMLNQGQHGRERILSRPSVELMTTDHLTLEQKAVSGFFPGFFDNTGWGFGVSVVTRRDDVSLVPGRFGWDGGYGTSWASDPQEDLVGILLTQRVMDSPEPPGPFRDFWTLAYQAIDD